MVDGSTVVSNISFSGTGSWTTRNETSGTNVSLSTGTKLIRLQATNSSGLSNIDHISMTGINPAPVSCTGLKSGGASAELTSIGNSFEININPNPVNRTLNIEFNEELTEGATIQLFDNTGRMVLNSKVKGFGHTLDMGNMEPGIYLLKVSNNYQSMNKRVIKN